MDELIKKHYDRIKHYFRGDKMTVRLNSVTVLSAELTKEVAVKFAEWSSERGYIKVFGSDLWFCHGEMGDGKKKTTQELFDQFIKETYGNENK